VETKRITASDHSSNTAGDIQIKSGSRVIDAFEVTAKLLEEKSIPRNRQSVLTLCLESHHAAVEMPDEMLADLRGRNEDISVIDLSFLVPVLAAELTKPFRAVALNGFTSISIAVKVSRN